MAWKTVIQRRKDEKPPARVLAWNWPKDRSRSELKSVPTVALMVNGDKLPMPLRNAEYVYVERGTGDHEGLVRVTKAEPVEDGAQPENSVKAAKFKGWLRIVVWPLHNQDLKDKPKAYPTTVEHDGDGAIIQLPAWARYMPDPNSVQLTDKDFAAGEELAELTDSAA